MRQQLVRLSSLLGLAASLASCGGGDDSPAVDARPPVDAGPDAPACTAITTGEQEIRGQGMSSISWRAPVTMPDLGGGGPAVMQFEFYGGIHPNLVSTWNLAMAEEANYATCAVCLRVFSLDAAGMVAKQFFQSGGSLTLNQDPLMGLMAGNVTDLSLVEVTVDPMTFESTPVAGGTCLSIGSLTLDADTIPLAWTCPDASYGDNTNCNCACGAVDPDCDAEPALPVMGCTAGQVCDTGVCVQPPTNDTCGTAAPITIGTPVMGTTVGGTSNTNLGLEPDTCTGFSQAGPDVMYRVDLTMGQAITVTLTPAATFDPSISIVGPGAATVCDVSPIVCLRGADAGLNGDVETFMYTATAAGTHYLIVDAFSGTGTFTLNVTSP